MQTIPNPNAPAVEIEVVLDEVLEALKGPKQTAAKRHAMARRVCQALGLKAA